MKKIIENENNVKNDVSIIEDKKEMKVTMEYKR
jgi:hypothetical protein